MHFNNPLALLLLVFLPFALEPGHVLKLLKRFGMARKSKTPAKAILFSFPVALSKFPGSALGSKRNLMLSLLNGMAFLMLVIALARPQSGGSFTEIQASGRDIMLVLDVSPSMQALDFAIDDKRVNRLEALKTVVNKFVEQRVNDRIGLIVFAGRVFTQCPLTLDHGVLEQFIEELQIGMAGDGTAVGDAVGIAIKRLKNIDSESKTLVLVTDGESNMGTLSPGEAGELAATLKVKIYSIGIGSNKPAPFPVQGFFGMTSYVNRVMEFDEKTLIQLAEKTGGKYFNAQNTEQLSRIYDYIDKLEERKESTLQYTEYEEDFLPWILGGLGLWLLQGLLKYSIFLKIP